MVTAGSCPLSATEAAQDALPRVPGQANAQDGAEAREWRIDLPFTTPPLKDNDRYSHWAKKARVVAELRRQAFWLTLAQHIPTLAHAVITLHWQPGVNRNRDNLSIAPSLKPLVDGIADARAVPDDTTRHVDPRCCVHDWQRGVAAGCWVTIVETLA